MHTVQKRCLEGVVAVTGATATRAVTLPLLPRDGAWSFTGQLIAVDEATPHSSVTFFPVLSGSCAAGVVTQNKMSKFASQSSEGGRALALEPGGLSVSITKQQLEIEVTGIAGKTILWAWSLELLVVSIS